MTKKELPGKKDGEEENWRRWAGGEKGDGD